MNNSADIRHRSLPKAPTDDYDFTDDAIRRNPKARRRKHKTKSRYSDSEGEAEDRGIDVLPKWKMVLVIGAICVCFALIFPTVFTPFINGLWGRQGGDNNANGARRPTGSRSPPPSRGVPVMHPQMHMPQGGAGVEATGSRGRGGMFTWMMPFYTIGIVAFLGYSLYKRMFKPGKRKKSHRYEEESENSDSDEGIELGGRKLRMVQRRLRKTEAAMRQILEQLENIAEASGEVIKDTTASSAPNLVNANNEDVDPRLSDEQVKAVERGLRELRELSDLYKRQQQEIDDDYDENDDNDNSKGYIPSDVDDNPNYQAQEIPISKENDGSPGRNSDNSVVSGRKASTNESYENINPLELSAGEKVVERTTITEENKLNLTESPSQTQFDGPTENTPISEDQHVDQDDPPNENKFRRHRRPRRRRRGVKKD